MQRYLNKLENSLIASSRELSLSIYTAVFAKCIMMRSRLCICNATMVRLLVSIYGPLKLELKNFLWINAMQSVYNKFQADILALKTATSYKFQCIFKAARLENYSEKRWEQEAKRGRRFRRMNVPLCGRGLFQLYHMNILWFIIIFADDLFK